MSLMSRYSEPYSATGGLAAEGVLNQLGRPNIEPLEVLVREAVQNCWDAKRTTAPGITVEVGRRSLDSAQRAFCRDELLIDPPPGLPLATELDSAPDLLYFADFGTDGLGGPTRADQAGHNRDFVDFVRNIGQPPDKDLGGGSYGYGKAAFYIASRARTILIDTLCIGLSGQPEHRFIACGLGYNFDDDAGRPHTGRHWWGQIVDGVPEPLTGEAADSAAEGLGLPRRRDRTDLGTTIVIVAPGVAVRSADADHSMSFIAEALAWNFWPRMIDTPGAGRRTMDFRVLDDTREVRVPNPRSHQRLREFVEAMDRQREDPGEDAELLLDREIRALRPARRLGRLVIKKGSVVTVDSPERPVPVGARLTADALHHVALMRNAELVVRYLPGAVPVAARMGYAGVFKCSVDVDEAFRAAEPPTHDDWVFRGMPRGQDRSFVKISLERVAGVCREAAGYETSIRSALDGVDVPLGEFADSLASLLPGVAGPGARKQPASSSSRGRRRRAPGRPTIKPDVEDFWIDGTRPENGPRTATDQRKDGDLRSGGSAPETTRLAPPQLRSVGDPVPTIGDDGIPVVRYPFELRCRGNRVRLSASVEIMSSDGGQVEPEAPIGVSSPSVHGWIDPTGHAHRATQLDAEVGADGQWAVDIELLDETMMRLDLNAEAI
jgi:hypothetical protein